ncbi:uncharacterized protein LOC114287393 [Camellia sinensis]|uniref:uncharacterized protein LOC114287393 n=1 Tax=Camellia sinensis TaxID=4442 RepID=UPI001036C907|nr:uncharacterized protein LOC114287393 [Camellia sinensis]
MKAEAWVLEMEKLFEVFPSIDTQKVSLAAFTLEDEARRWWMMIRKGNPDLTWARFSELFYDNHFPRSVRDRKTTEFQMLAQGSKTVAEYDHKAILAEANLNRSQSSGKNQRKRQTYDNREEVADPNDAEEKTEEDSPNSANQEGGTRPTCGSCGKLHFGVCLRATGACFGCGERGHRIKDCPKVKARDDQKR